MSAQPTTAISGRVICPLKKPIVPVYARDGKSLIDPKVAVIVVAGPKELKYPPPPIDPVRIVSDNGRLTPSFCVCVIGQELLVTSIDAMNHHFHLSGTEYRESARVTPDHDEKRFVRVFRKPIKWLSLSCASHPTEKTMITVSPSNLYSIPNSMGVYRIESRFPRGDYKLRAISPKYGVLEKTVTIRQGDEVVELDFHFEE